MKRFVLYALILALVWVTPIERVDIGKLRPVEVIAVYKSGNTVVLATDTEDLGIGRNAEEALEDMRSTSPAVIYLDTAEYLLIAEDAEEEAETLRDELKKSVRLCGVSGKVDLKNAAKFLPVHGKLPSLRNWKAEDTLPVIRSEDGRIKMS